MNSRHRVNCKFALNLIQFSTISNLYPLEVVPECQFCQLCVSRENLNHLVTSKVERIMWVNENDKWPHKRLVYNL